MGATVKVIHTSIITEWTIKKTRNIKRTVCVCVWQLCLLPSAMFCVKQRSGWACEICMTALANLDAVISFSCAFILVFVCVSGYVHQRIYPAMDAQDKTIWIMRYENILCMTMTYLCILGPLSVYFSLFFFSLFACLCQCAAGIQTLERTCMECHSERNKKPKWGQCFNCILQ